MRKILLKNLEETKETIMWVTATILIKMFYLKGMGSQQGCKRYHHGISTLKS